MWWWVGVGSCGQLWVVVGSCGQWVYEQENAWC